MYKRIRDLREENDFTQKYIASYLMCDQSLYSKYERGLREIPLNIIIKLAQFYGTSVDYIVNLTDEKNAYPKSDKL